VVAERIWQNEKFLQVKENVETFLKLTVTPLNLCYRQGRKIFLPSIKSNKIQFIQIMLYVVYHV